MLDYLKKSWVLPSVVVLIALVIVVKMTHFSFTDYIAGRVIRRLNAEYNPYGPNMQQSTPPVISAPQPPVAVDPVPTLPPAPPVVAPVQPDNNRPLRPWRHPNDQ